MKKHPSISPLVSLIFVMACVAAGFFVVLKAGFLMHGNPLPAPFDNAVLTAAAVTVLVAGLAALTVKIVRSGGEALTGARIRREANASASEWIEARRLRVAELAADPARAKYAPLVEQGEDWSEENIAYYEDPAATVTCDHLQPIERALREAGVDVRRFQTQDVTAKCRIDLPALQARFTTAPPVRYAEFYYGERDAYDHPAAHLICDEHKSLIHTKHPEEYGAQELPSFPPVSA